MTSIKICFYHWNQHFFCCFSFENEPLLLEETCWISHLFFFSIDNRESSLCRDVANTAFFMWYSSQATLCTSECILVHQSSWFFLISAARVSRTKQMFTHNIGLISCMEASIKNLLVNRDREYYFISSFLKTIFFRETSLIWLSFFFLIISCSL